jgi:AraC-like DNA-binding protein
VYLGDLDPHAFSIHHRVAGPNDDPTGPTHQNPGWELSWVTAGTMGFLLSEEATGDLQARAGGGFVLPPDVTNTPRGREAAVWQLLVGRERVALARETLPGARDPGGPRVLAGNDRLVALMRVLASVADEGATEADPGLCALVDAIAIELVRAPPAPCRVIEPGIGRALARIEEQFASPLSIEDLARTANLPRFRFLRDFRAAVGESPYRWLTRRRLEAAAARLQRSDESITDVAYACGFGDPGRFARMFADRFGCTPRQWRRR